MNRLLIKISLINLQLFCVFFLCLFFFVISRSGGSHNINTETLLQIFLGFVILHLLINGILLYRSKAKYFDIIVTYLEVLILYGLIVWGFFL